MIGRTENDSSSGSGWIIRVGFISALLSLVLGILFGFAALSYRLDFPFTNIFYTDVQYHPFLMVFGFLAILLITEKIQSMEMVKFGPFRLSRLTIGSLVMGITLYYLSIPLRSEFLMVVGALLLALSSLLFLHFIVSPITHGNKYIKTLSGLSIFSLASLAVVSTLNGIMYSGSMALLATVFPVLYVIAERIELGFMRGMSQRLIETETVLGALLLAMFLDFSIQPGPLSVIPSNAGLFFLGAFSAIAARYDPAFRRSTWKGPLQRFMNRGVAIAYVWLFTGILLFSLSVNGYNGLLDAATHSIMIGFVGTFIFAHSPIIFPLLFKKEMNQDRVTFAPILILTISVIMRVGGDLLSIISPYGGFVSYLSPVVLVVSAIAFFYNIKLVTTPKHV